MGFVNHIQDAMYGKSCIGLVVSKYDSLFGVGGNLVQYIQSKIGKEISESDAQELIDEMLSEVFSDTMGRDDIIIYFENVRMPEEDDNLYACSTSLICKPFVPTLVRLHNGSYGNLSRDTVENIVRLETKLQFILIQ